MPTITLVRHGDRKPKSKELSVTGKREIEKSKSFFSRINHSSDLILTSNRAHALETTLILKEEGVKPVKLNSLTDCKDYEDMHSFEDILEECEEAKKSLANFNNIVIVGHEPWISKLITQLTSTRVRPLKSGECAIVTAKEFNQFIKGDGKVTSRYPVYDYQEELLRSKVQSKMQVATFLAGFTFTTLSGLVISNPQLLSSWWNLLALVCLLVALSLFIASVYIYDALSMPSGFWIDQDRRSWWSGIMESNNFRKDVNNNGPVYAFMIRTWTMVFTPAVFLSVIGFILLLVNIPDTNLRGGLLALSGAVIMVAIIYYSWLKPNLGID